MTLPACRIDMAGLVAAIGAQTGAMPELVTYQPDAGLQATFGNYPPLQATRATSLGFRDDGSIDQLVRATLSNLLER